MFDYAHLDQPESTVTRQAYDFEHLPRRTRHVLRRDRTTAGSCGARRGRVGAAVRRRAPGGTRRRRDCWRPSRSGSAATTTGGRGAGRTAADAGRGPVRRAAHGPRARRPQRAVGPLVNARPPAWGAVPRRPLRLSPARQRHRTGHARQPRPVVRPESGRCGQGGGGGAHDRVRVREPGRGPRRGTTVWTCGASGLPIRGRRSGTRSRAPATGASAGGWRPGRRPVAKPLMSERFMRIFEVRPGYPLLLVPFVTVLGVTWGLWAAGVVSRRPGACWCSSSCGRWACRWAWR